MTISVVVPIYNMERYLAKCIDSILGQTVLPREILLVDDGSSDSSLSICNEYKHRTDLIKVIHQENGGVSSARNAGIDAVTSEWVCFIDPDDWVESGYLSSLRSFHSGSDLVVGGYKVVGMENYLPGNKTAFSQKEYSRIEFFKNFSRFRNDNLLSSILSSPINKLYRIDIIRDYSLRFDTSLSLGEDYLFNLEYFKHCKKIVVIEETLYNYLIRPDSLSRGISYNTALSQIRLYDETCSFIEQYIRPVTEKVDIVSFKLFLFVYIVLSCIRNRTVTKPECIVILQAVKKRFKLNDFLVKTSCKFQLKWFAFVLYICNPSTVFFLIKKGR